MGGVIPSVARDLGGRGRQDRVSSLLPPRSLATLGMTRVAHRVGFVRPFMIAMATTFPDASLEPKMMTVSPTRIAGSIVVFALTEIVTSPLRVVITQDVAPIDFTVPSNITSGIGGST